MDRMPLDPEVNVDGPVLHGEFASTVFEDEEPEFVDDVSALAAEAEDEPVWSIDTGYGEFFAPAGREGPVLP